MRRSMSSWPLHMYDGDHDARAAVQKAALRNNQYHWSGRNGLVGQVECVELLSLVLPVTWLHLLV